jgi:hypothetical protein
LELDSGRLLVREDRATLDPSDVALVDAGLLGEPGLGESFVTTTGSLPLRQVGKPAARRERTSPFRPELRNIP